MTVLLFLLAFTFSAPGTGDANAGVESDPNMLEQWVRQMLAEPVEDTPPAVADANRVVSVVHQANPNDVNVGAQDSNVPQVKNAQRTSKARHTSALAAHAVCADFLMTYVNDSGLVDYKTLRRKRLDLIATLTDYAGVEPNEYSGWSKQDQLAYWINIYNLCTIKEVVDNYPIQASSFKMLFYPANSLMQVYGAWDKAQFTVMGENYTLTEIEQKILRKFGEPRVCLAINYASLGCAPLRREPYIGRNLSEQFDDQARRFVATDRGFRIDRDEPAIYLSAIFEWYGKDFQAAATPAGQFADKDPAQAAVLNYLIKIVSQKDSDWMVRKIYPVKFMRFNWVLNEQH